MDDPPSPTEKKKFVLRKFSALNMVRIGQRYTNDILPYVYCRGI